MQCDMDIGISATCSGIPLLSTVRAKFTPRFTWCMALCPQTHDVNSKTRVCVVVYPILSQHIKSLLHI